MSTPGEISSMSLSDVSASNDKTPFSDEPLNEKTSLPTLDDKPLAHQAKSQALLVAVVLGAVAGCWLLGFELFQVRASTSWTQLALLLGGVGAAALGLLCWTGTHSLDIWTLVMRWGWYTLPAVGATGLLFVMMQERTEEMGKVE